MPTFSVYPCLIGAKMEQQQRVSASIGKRAQNQIPPSKPYSTDAPSNEIVQAGSNTGDTTTDDSDENSISGVLNDKACKNTVQPSPATVSRSSSAGETDFRTFKGEDSTNRKPKHNVTVDKSQKPKQANLEKKNEVMHPESDGADDIPVQKPKARLGKIGGKSNAIKSSDPNEHKNPSFEPKSSTSRDRRKLTALDAQDKVYSSLSSDPNQLKERASLPQELPSPQRETSQERADHRREQLKRNLETTAITSIRKKRKF